MIEQQRKKTLIGLFCDDRNRMTNSSRKQHIVLILIGFMIGVMMMNFLVEAKSHDEFNNVDIGGEEGRRIVLLQPGREFISESIRPTPFYDEKVSEQKSSVRIYKLVNMKPHTQYELRISYPSYTPAVFSIDILSEEELENRIKMSKPSKHSRKLLNIEKIMFKLDGEDGKLLNRFALVSAKVEAPSTIDNTNSLIYYNIGKFVRY